MTAGRRAGWFVFAGALVFFSIGAASRGLWHADEHRIAEVSRVMAQPGGDWIVPHLDGAVYAHKPPVVPWIIAFLHGTVGLDLPLAAKVPSILGAALAVLATFLIARRLYGHTAAVAAAVVLATAGEFDWICRRAQYDPLLTGFTTLAMWFFVRSRFPGPDGRDTPWRDALLGALCVGLGGMVKGPAAIAFTVPGIVAFAVAAREGRALATPRLAAMSAVLVPAGIWLAAAASRAGSGYVTDLVLGHGVAHATGDVDKVEPAWYYLVAFPKGFLPWTLFLPAAVLAATNRGRDEERRSDRFALVWFGASFALMSLVPAKRDLYLLPLYPAAAICVGKLAALDEERFRGAAYAVPRRIVGTVSVAGGIAAVAVAALVMTGSDRAIEERVAGWADVRGAIGWPGPVLAGLCGAALALVGWRTLRDASPARAFGHALVAAVVASIGFAAVVLPCADAAISPRPFYEKAAALVGAAPLARYGVDDHAGHWAMRRDVIPYFSRRAEVTRFLAKAPGPAFVVAERQRVERMGMPEGARVVLEAGLPREDDLLLLVRE